MERGLVQVKGDDCCKFLHSMVTSNVNKLLLEDRESCQYSAFLNHTGRVLFDVFLWRQASDTVLIDCQRPYVMDVMTHLAMYKLRAKVDISNVTGKYKVFGAFEPSEAHQSRQALMKIRDTRSNWTMSRYLLDSALCNEADFVFKGLERKTRHEYRIMRMLHGVPEGFVEIKSGHAIPFDFNLDLMGAVDTSGKGCYIGQELVTRTLHQGQIRKRCRAIQIFDPDRCNVLKSAFEPDPAIKFQIVTETEMMGAIVRDGADTHTYFTEYSADYQVKMGRIVRTIGNMGLALVKHPGDYAAVMTMRPSMALVKILPLAR